MEAKIYNWFGVPIYEARLNTPDYSKSLMIDFFNNYSKDNIADNNVLSGRMHERTDNIAHLINFFWLSDQIGHHCEKYIDQIGADCKNQSFYIQKFWPVVMKNGGYIDAHIHKDSDLSAVFYLQKDDGDVGGEIEFIVNNQYLSNLPVNFLDKKNTIEYNMPENVLIIFPSSLMHRVKTYNGVTQRFSINTDIKIASSPENWIRVPKA